jgi:hypothetical protein
MEQGNQRNYQKKYSYDFRLLSTFISIENVKEKIVRWIFREAKKA